MPPVGKQPVGRQWRGLLEDPERAAREFPALAEQIADPVGRRATLKLLAASLALGAAGCDPAAPDGVLIPTVIPPPEIVPGLANRYSTASLAGGTALGIVVTHQMGRPIKVEGNPEHPASLGATDAFAQALILDFYDPDRSTGLLHRGKPAADQALLAALAAQRERLGATRGAGFRVLTGGTTSPTLGAALDRLLARSPEARWHQWEPVNRDAVRAGMALAYGRPVEAVPRLAEADVILALDGDLLNAAPGHVRLARDFAARRNPARSRMNRLYAAEPGFTPTGAVADHRFVAGPAEMHAAVMALAAGVLRGEAPGQAPPWVGPVVADLRAHRGRALVHVGPGLPAEVHALVAAVNDALAAPLDLIEPPEYRPVRYGESLDELTREMREGRVETLLVVDSNPAFTAPGFEEAMGRVKTVLVSAPSLDETGRAATWYVPETHLFEAWGDARAHDGTATVLQPQSLPLFGGRSALELVCLFSDPVPVRPLDAVRATWRERLPDDEAWHDALATGVIPGTANPRAAVSLRPEAARAVPPAPPVRPLSVLFRPDPHLWDGRFANNLWLQELPRPLTKLVWDNPLLVAPSLAARMGLENGAEVALEVGGRSVTAPVWIAPGQADGVVVAELGFGRRTVGRVGQGTGYDYYPLRDADGPASLRPTGRRVALASTVHHDGLVPPPEGVVRHATLAEFHQNPSLLKGTDARPALYRRPPPADVQWGMSVDLNACIGCNACVIACQAENNVPVVGKDSVLREREMHWLRIDRYYEGAIENPDSFFQPMLCMHCEQAPCEVVCPVGATVHDEEGLNVMVYNRCVGTRFCSNNCPYKVRRFNYFPFAKEEKRPPISRNPDVSVRARGVMEKCTFCIQRIAEARIAHDRDGVPEAVVTACQAACPTRAFAFGDINDAESEVVRRKQSPLDYPLLADLNTHPRVTYEGRIRNRNPEIEA